MELIVEQGEVFDRQVSVQPEQSSPILCVSGGSLYSLDSMFWKQPSCCITADWQGFEVHISLIWARVGFLWPECANLARPVKHLNTPMRAVQVCHCKPMHPRGQVCHCKPMPPRTTHR